MKEFELSEIQAQAILDLRLRALTALERKRVEDEHKDLVERIGELRTILGDESRIGALIREELLEIKQIYGQNDDRRTEIIAAEGEFSLEDMIAEEDMVIAITRSNYIKRLPVTTYREQRRGGQGVMGMDLKEDDYIEHLFVASTHDYVLFFTNVGKVYRLKVHELPLGSRQSKGRAIQNLLPFRQGEQVRAVIQTRDFEESKFLVFATKKGIVKKTELAAYNTPLKADGIIAIKMRGEDELVSVRHSTGEDDILMVSRKGQAIRFSEKEARSMGRDTGGVKGMGLRKGDEVITSDVVGINEGDLLVVTENGYGKRTKLADYPRKGRGGLGVKTVQLTEARGQLVGARIVQDGYQVMLISNGGTVIKIPVEDVKRLGRSTQGVIVMRLRKGEQVSALAPVVEPEDDEVPRSRPPSRRPSPGRADLARLPAISSGFRTKPFTKTAKSDISSPRGVSFTPPGESDGRQQTSRSSRANRSRGASGQDRAVPGPGVPDRGHLEDAARLLDEQGSDSDARDASSGSTTWTRSRR